MALLHGRAGRLTAQTGGFRPGQMTPQQMTTRQKEAPRQMKIKLQMPLELRMKLRRTKKNGSGGGDSS